MERKVVERAHTQPAACVPSAPGANCLRQQGSLISPFPVSPGGKPGRAGSPHAAAAVPPARGVSKRSAETPIAHPPNGRQRLQMVSLDLRDRAGEKIKDGRHVGLDFYDLLIEERRVDGEGPGPRAEAPRRSGRKRKRRPKEPTTGTSKGIEREKGNT